jgi:hypothetical protein
VTQPATYRIGEGGPWSAPGKLGSARYFAAWLLLTVFLGMAQAKTETHRTWRWEAQLAAALAPGGEGDGDPRGRAGLLAGGVPV